MASRTETVKRLKYYRELRDGALAVLKSLMESGDIESYTFGDPNGNQSTHRRKISELQKALEDYEKQIDALERSLRGGGVRVFSTNRYRRTDL